MFNSGVGGCCPYECPRKLQGTLANVAGRHTYFWPVLACSNGWFSSRLVSCGERAGLRSTQ
jgi:hypothetical protein